MTQSCRNFNFALITHFFRQILILKFSEFTKKNPHRRHWIFRPMRIVSPLPWRRKKKKWGDLKKILNKNGGPALFCGGGPKEKKTKIGWVQHYYIYIFFVGTFCAKLDFVCSFLVQQVHRWKVFKTLISMSIYLNIALLGESWQQAGRIEKGDGGLTRIQPGLESPGN